MIELLATVVITVSSVLLFAYWFRYTCLLILSAKTSRDYSGEFANANKLGFQQVQSQLQEASHPDLDLLRTTLDRDYELVRKILKYMESSEGQSALETRMLAINYRLMGSWYSISRHFSPRIAVRALEEMSMVVAHFANAMGEHAHAGSAA